MFGVGQKIDVQRRARRCVNFPGDVGSDLGADGACCQRLPSDNHASGSNGEQSTQGTEMHFESLVLALVEVEKCNLTASTRSKARTHRSEDDR